MQLIINDIAVVVNKKNIKNMHLYVKPPDGHVEVSAPIEMMDANIEMFIRSRIGWIKKQKEKFANQSRQSIRQYVTGETVYVWGKPYYLQVKYSYRGNSMILDGKKAVLTVRKESTTSQRESFINEWYRDILKSEIIKRLPKWEAVTGIHCNDWQTKYMTTRWGTCNAETGKIWINLQLAKKSAGCLDYVLLHELVHLKEKNHGARFIAILDEYMAYWRIVRKELNDQILDYME